MSTTLSKARNQTSAARNPMVAFREEMDDLLRRVWDGNGNWFATPYPYEPQLDLVEEDHAFEIRADVPGMTAKDIDVQVHGNTVTISGKREEQSENKGKEFHRIERRAGSFLRTLALPCNVNEDEVVAAYENGVLTLKLPKCEENRGKKIEVKG